MKWEYLYIEKSLINPAGQSTPLGQSSFWALDRTTCGLSYDDDGLFLHEQFPCPSTDNKLQLRLEELIGQAGTDEWELVSVVCDPDGDRATWWFKRPLES